MNYYNEYEKKLCESWKMFIINVKTTATGNKLKTTQWPKFNLYNKGIYKGNLPNNSPLKERFFDTRVLILSFEIRRY